MYTSVTPRLLDLPRVRERVPYSRSWIYAALTRGDFPKPIRLGPGRVAWREDEIDAWVQGKIGEAV